MFPRPATWKSAGLAVLILTAGVSSSFGETPDVERLFGPASPKTLFRWSVARDESENDDEDPRLVTDRPHFSEASNLVGLGRIQLETGYSLFRDHDEGPVIATHPLPGPPPGQVVTTHSFPEPLLRMGILADWFEFRLGYNFLVETTSDSIAGRSVLRGSDDMYVGAKLALTEQAGWLPEMALFPQMRVPTGSPAFTSKQVLPGFNLAYSWKVNDLIEIECNTQMNRRHEDGDHFYTEAIQTVNIEYDLSRRWGAFTEWIVFVPSGAVSAQTQHYFHGGFVYFVTNNVQLDIHSAVGLNKAADDLAFTGVGFSIRR